MKKISLLFIALVTMMSAGFAQTKKTAATQTPAAPVWAEMKAFHAIMSTTFHPAEEGNFAPLKEKAPELYTAAKVWYASPVPAEFKPAETTEALEKLMIKCSDVWAAVEAKSDDAKLKSLITEAHDIFHKISGTCKRSEK
jgi:hypothetical protein